MTRPTLSCLCSLVCALLLTAHADAAEKPSPIGRTIADFTLKDFRGKSHSLSDYKQSRLVVVAFVGTECPLAKLYAPRLAALDAKYRDRGVTILALNANQQDSITEIAAFARVHEIKFPVLKDLGNKLADRFAAERTPEVFVLDAQRVIRYAGRIDDQYGIGYIRDEPQRNDLALALDQLLAGNKVEQPLTTAVGCIIGRVHEPNPEAKVTYSGQIAGILQKHCVECHREGEIAPFALTEYDEVAGWAEMIAEVIEDRRMPPWHADPEFGHFANARLMSEEEKQLVYRWVAEGAPLGEESKIPPLPERPVVGWRLTRKPDLVVNMREKPFTVPAEGVVRYQYFSVDPGLQQDKWVRMAEIIPGNRAVVHHILVFVRPPRGRLTIGAGGGGFLAGYVPGMRAEPFPEGMAKRIPAGSKLVFQVHYTPIGSVQQDLSKVGFVFADAKEITHEVVTTRAWNRSFRIPPGDRHHRVEATSKSVPVDLLLLSLTPHMHLRGKSFQYEALYPDGTRETLLNVPAYDFNWQTAYRLADPKQMPAGTRMHCVAQFDNSEDNLSNPDPTVTVRWGDQTWDEMMIGYFDVAVRVKPSATGAASATGRESGTNAANPKPEPQVTAADRAKALAAKYDRNQNGTVELDEVPTRLSKLFQRLDTNGDERLSVQEIEKLTSLLPR